MKCVYAGMNREYEGVGDECQGGQRVQQVERRATSSVEATANRLQLTILKEKSWENICLLSYRGNIVISIKNNISYRISATCTNYYKAMRTM